MYSESYNHSARRRRLAVHGRLLTMSETVIRTGLSKEEIKQRIAKKQFPSMVSISTTWSGFPEDEVHDFIVSDLQGE